MATKVYRFCLPDRGASVDRHSSYFFNSLDTRLSDRTVTKATCFKREWTAGCHKTSRLAIYNPSNLSKNLGEYVSCYLPLLERMATALNEDGREFRCAATGQAKR